MPTLKTFATRNKANEGIWIEFASPEPNAAPLRIKVLGKDSDAYRRTEAAHREALVKKGNLTGNFMTTPEEVEAQTMELLIACTVGWENLNAENEDGTEGGPLPLTPATVRDLYEANPLVRERVDRAITDRALFLGR